MEEWTPSCWGAHSRNTGFLRVRTGHAILGGHGWNHALCRAREKKAVQLVIKDGDRVISWEAFGYAKFKKEEQDTYGVFLNDGNTELVSTTDHEVYIQTVQDYSQGRAVEAIIAIKKEQK